MIRFVDLNTGNIFNPGNAGIDSSYVFWFDNEQSIDLIYSKPICFISDSSMVSISMPKNEVFHLIDDTLIQIGEKNDINKLYTDNSLIKSGAKYISDNIEYYLYIFYVTAQAKQSGEYSEIIHISDMNNAVITSIKIGADFYEENESLYINLSNNGLEIPSSIQKALYGSNVYEDKKDNILLNRKWKELLSNLWDVYINKGSYKSLYNSLKWFEYGDELKLREAWKDKSSDSFFLQDISDHMSEKYISSFDGLTKTTYYSLSYALDQITGFEGGVNDKKPILEKISNQWSVNEMALKLCLLGFFYKQYFMPIHLDLLFHTIENTVYMNNIKRVVGVGYERIDCIYETSNIECNVQNGDCFTLDNVECYVGPKTLFGNNWDGISDTVNIIGVQKEQIEESLTEDQMISYNAQLYKAPGCVVDFKIKLNLEDGDKIKREQLFFKNPSNEWSIISNQFIYGSEINFSLLCQKRGDYEARVQFDSLLGHRFTKSIKFSVIDSDNVELKIYKIKRKNKLRMKDLLNPSHNSNNYTHTLQYSNVHKNILHQYIPANIAEGDGVGLNHLLIYKNVPHAELDDFYFSLFRDVKTKDSEGNDIEHKYYIYISKEFISTGTTDLDKLFEELKAKLEAFKQELENKLESETDPSIQDLYKDKIEHLKNDPEVGLFRHDTTFLPEFHRLEEFGKITDILTTNTDDFTITDGDALCIIPEIQSSVKFNGYEWEFINNSTRKSIKLNHSIKEPFIAQTEKSPLTPGYYSIKFRYRLTGENKINEILLDSAFIKR